MKGGNSSSNKRYKKINYKPLSPQALASAVMELRIMKEQDRKLEQAQTKYQLRLFDIDNNSLVEQHPPENILTTLDKVRGIMAMRLKQKQEQEKLRLQSGGTPENKDG